MTSLATIALPSQNELDLFCSINKTSRVSVAKLAFATVLHQFFDLTEFTYAEALPNDHDDNTHYLTTGSQKVQYASDIASTTSICTALGVGKPLRSSDDDSPPLLANHTKNTTPNDQVDANGLSAGLVLTRTTYTTEEKLYSSIDERHNDLDLVVYFDEVSLSAHMLYSTERTSSFVAKGFADAISAAIQSISSSPLDTAVADLDMCGTQSRATIASWNQFSPTTPNKLLHDLVGQGFRHKPDAVAIVSWDGHLTYSELEKRSTTLAAYLMDTYDLKPGKRVALCFEKCTWAIVSMLAVLKTGAAYCCLDPSHPRARHDSIIQTLNGSLVLASLQYEDRFDGHSVLVPNMEIIQQEIHYQPSNVQPSDVCMVAFTSGSTGNPKGIVHTHNSLVTGIVSNATPQHLDREGVSTFQWSSFTFDVSMIEIYAPLIFGGRVCIPSDEERINNVEESMNRMAVNWAYFTPSFARLFAQYEIPSLQTLLMGGEVVTPDDINAWINRVRVIHSYGPAESATFFLYEFKGPCGKIVPIGPAPNTYSWVVNPNNPELLSPLGAIGEMLYEGPGLLQEYLGGPKKTSQVLIDPPSWRQSLGVPAPSCKLYRSGDLVRYLPDGTLMYIGRKDTMVKVRGQKLEVEEVESVIRKSLGGSGQVAVDLVELHDSGPRLVAFLQSSETQDKDAHTKTGSTGKLRSNFIPDDKMTALISRIRSHLVETLPAFMIPRIFIPLAALPTNSNGKLDRARLKQHARSLPTSELFKYTDSGSSDGVLTDIPKDDTVALKISEILLNVLGDTVSNEESSLKGKNATLENLGLDSLRTVSFARAINSSFGLDIPIKTFRRVNLKVRDLAEIVRSRNQVAGQSEEHTHAADILQDIEKLSEELAEMQPYQGEYSKKGLPTSSRVVFLTGATGFLGSQILRQLLALDHVSKVIVLVRARDASAGFERIVAAATTSRWWSPALANRIEVWPGDLAQPRLGVSMDRWAYLESKAVTDIIHNGAVVNWSWSYERLRATNVLSTLQILKLALAGQIQHYTYISGGDMHLTEKAVAEDLSHLSSADGYSQSKFASDVLVDRCASRAPSGTRINMVKPGIIIGTATEGISNTDDFIWRLAAGVCEAGAYVDGEQDAMVCLAGADQVAQRIIQSCLGGPDCDGTPRALRMTQGIPVRDFWNMVSKGTGITLRAMEFVDWFQVVNANVARQGSSHLLWPVMEWVEQRKGRIGDPHLIRCQSSNCSGHCLGVGEETLAVQCQPDDETKNKTLQALSKSIDYLSALRFLQGGIALKDGNQDVFSRSKAVN